LSEQTENVYENKAQGQEVNEWNGRGVEWGSRGWSEASGRRPKGADGSSTPRLLDCGRHSREMQKMKNRRNEAKKYLKTKEEG
jgi:hypothetical protein